MSHELDTDSLLATPVPVEHRWSIYDTMLYALAIGVGDEDLSFTTENTAGVQPQVLPSFATLVGLGDAVGTLPGLDWDLPILHGEQSVDLMRPLTVDGHIMTTDRVIAVVDKGSGVAIVTEAESVDAASGEPWFRTTSTTFVPGATIDRSVGAPPVLSPIPERDPDQVVRAATRRDQALLYRMCGDRNRLHSDPEFAAAAGFDRPILHGLCTFGIAGWLLVRDLCKGFAGGIQTLRARFSAPVMPGDPLLLQTWVVENGHARFRMLGPSGATVLDRGELRFDP